MTATYERDEDGFFTRESWERQSALDAGIWHAEHSRVSEFATQDEIDQAVEWIKSTRRQLLRAIKLFQDDRFPGSRSDGADHQAVEQIAARRRAAWAAAAAEAAARRRTDEAWERELRRRENLSRPNTSAVTP